MEKNEFKVIKSALLGCKASRIAEILSDSVSTWFDIQYLHESDTIEGFDTGDYVSLCFDLMTDGVLIVEDTGFYLDPAYLHSLDTSAKHKPKRWLNFEDLLY
jgi:hypothetical protein